MRGAWWNGHDVAPATARCAGGEANARGLGRSRRHGCGRRCDRPGGLLQALVHRAHPDQLGRGGDRAHRSSSPPRARHCLLLGTELWRRRTVHGLPVQRGHAARGDCHHRVHWRVSAVAVRSTARRIDAVGAQRHRGRRAVPHLDGARLDAGLWVPGDRVRIELRSPAGRTGGGSPPRRGLAMACHRPGGGARLVVLSRDRLHRDRCGSRGACALVAAAPLGAARQVGGPARRRLRHRLAAVVVVLVSDQLRHAPQPQRSRHLLWRTVERLLLPRAPAALRLPADAQRRRTWHLDHRRVAHARRRRDLRGARGSSALSDLGRRPSPCPRHRSAGLAVRLRGQPGDLVFRRWSLRDLPAAALRAGARHRA